MNERTVVARDSDYALIAVGDDYEFGKNGADRVLRFRNALAEELGRDFHHQVMMQYTVSSILRNLWEKWHENPEVITSVDKQ